MEQLIEEIKQYLIEDLPLEDITPAEIDAEAPLFGDEGLGLDSIDALEITIMLEKRFGIKIADPKAAKEIYSSVSSIAAYVQENRK
ncbi:MAG: phosphopantetheine-binding protein [Paludibacteraceae bacterium]|nr:acyl carrier protein [Candidatus Physcocola equi]MCQ2234989.1 phosphopantetheine-binding protein [Paludibacteraceae bacterium]